LKAEFEKVPEAETAIGMRIEAALLVAVAHSTEADKTVP
jgi:hypothetical protein